MTKSLEDVQSKLIDDLMQRDPSSDEASTIIKNLKTLSEAQNTLRLDPLPDPEPTGLRGFLHRNSGELIKVGGTISVVAIIGLIEGKGDIIFRSKASKFI